MKKCLPMALAALLLTGCGMSQNGKTVTEDDLLHHNFVLQSVDGVAVKPQPGNAPSIEFGEKMHVSGAMCNRFFGSGQLQNGVLTVKNLASTRMLCTDAQRNQWDQTLSAVLEKGAKISLNAQQLTLSGGDHVLVYTLRDWVQ
ncbi:Heat shock protein HslJ [Serratia plymuthica]|uniref:heat shock protein HslJ n=1 Tax=Serratia plymuthica TaxID=82996 RepID=UPI0002A1E787|nr:heat shock protein HslJ [Serratia plymuthica]EKF64278.1 heat shock protein HslJ [Serratia plymuthica A30]QJW55471.1 Heat shock protein HslJ [Serratia plymuthica]